MNRHVAHADIHIVIHTTNNPRMRTLLETAHAFIHPAESVIIIETYSERFSLKYLAASILSSSTIECLIMNNFVAGKKG